MAGCSKKEPPVKAKADGAAKPAVAAEQKSKPVQTPVIPPQARFVRPGATNVPAISPDESMRQMRARMYANAEKMVKNEVGMTAAAMEKSSADLLALVEKIRSQSPAARDAFAARQKAEAECARLIKDAPGMAELQARMGKAELDYTAAATKAGTGEDQEKARQALLAIHRQMVETETAARQAGGEYAGACEARDAAAKAYNEELSKNEEYQAALQQRAKFQDQYNGLVARLAELEKQEKQRP